MVDLERLGSLWTGFVARTRGFRYVLCFSSLADHNYQKVLVDSDW